VAVVRPGFARPILLFALEEMTDQVDFQSVAQSVDYADLRPLYQRPTDSPVWTDDQVDRARVIGFALIREPEPADQMLVAGDEERAEPPCRPIPDPADPNLHIFRTGASPVANIAPVDLQKSPAYVGQVIERQLNALGADGEFIRSVLDEISNRKHQVWCVGGAIRDLLADGPEARINDLDFTGTIGPGELWHAVRQRSRGQGEGDYRQRISARLVWSVTPPGRSKVRVIEYKPLARTGFQFPAWGGDLLRDSATRDLSVNALYYDNQRQIVADPTGRGVADLRGVPRIAFVLYRGDDPMEQACVILRCLKFRLRWPDLEMREAASWAAALHADLIKRIDPDQWNLLGQIRNWCVPQSDQGGPELEVATELGDIPRQLIKELQTRAAR
jgi:hypothetical protein